MCVGLWNILPTTFGRIEKHNKSKGWVAIHRESHVSFFGYPAEPSAPPFGRKVEYFVDE
jgi:hypothetical protein